MLARGPDASKLAPNPTHIRDIAQHPYLKPRKYIQQFFIKEIHKHKKHAPTHTPRAAANCS